MIMYAKSCLQGIICEAHDLHVPELCAAPSQAPEPAARMARTTWQSCAHVFKARVFSAETPHSAYISPRCHSQVHNQGSVPVGDLNLKLLAADLLHLLVSKHMGMLDDICQLRLQELLFDSIDEPPFPRAALSSHTFPACTMVLLLLGSELMRRGNDATRAPAARHVRVRWVRESSMIGMGKGIEVPSKSLLKPEISVGLV